MWNCKHEDDILPSDSDFNFSIMNDFPFDEYNTWRGNEDRYNNGYGFGTGEPMPKYKLEKLNINNIKYMGCTLYNNGTFDHKSLIITREQNKLIDNKIRLKLCQLINVLSCRKECMDYRYPRKFKIMQLVKQHQNKQHQNKQLESGRPIKWICNNCWKTDNWTTYNYSLQQAEIKTHCPECGSARTKLEKFKKVYLFENNNNEHDEKEYNLYKQRIQDIIDPLLNSNKYWIPTIFNYNKHNKEYNIQKNTINNLSYHGPTINKQIYDVLGRIFTRIVPMFEWVLSKRIHNMYDELQVIISIQCYQLKSCETYVGGLHREGYKEENVVAAAVYYFDISDDIVIGKDIFEINTSFYGACGGNNGAEKHEVNIREGYVLVLHNDNINHSLKILENVHDKLDLHRKIVVFMLVNPDKPMESSKLMQNTEMNVSKDDINQFEVCEIVVRGYYKSLNLLNAFPNEIMKIIVYYIVDNIKELREKRNQLRIERVLPSNLDLVSHGTPWIGLVN